MFHKEMVNNMSSIVRFVRIVATAASLFLAVTSAGALENGHFVIDSATGFAADGYDPVAYFADGTLREGKSEHEAMWGKVAWRFANEGNRDAFLRDPFVYAPSFGGRCPVALAQGHPAEGDPRLWVIYKDRLYFFYSQQNLREFQANPATIVAQAGDTWNQLFPF